MYDWNALWHQHQGYRTGYLKPVEDINTLARELDARLVRPADGPGDVAVYETDADFLLLGHANGLQILRLARHALFEVGIRFVPVAEPQVPAPCIEVRARNLASSESACWFGAVRKDEQGRAWLDKTLLSEGIMPPMPFDELSFTDNARFRDILYGAWQRALPDLTDTLARWVPEAERLRRVCARYEAIMRHAQAHLRHRFSAAERALIRQALRDLPLDTPEHCRGLWLPVERWWIASGHQEDLSDLIVRLRALQPAEEFALLESL